MIAMKHKKKDFNKELVKTPTFVSIHQLSAYILTFNTLKLQVGLKVQASTKTILNIFSLFVLLAVSGSYDLLYPYLYNPLEQLARN